MKNPVVFLFLATIFALTACDKEIQVTVPESGKHLVVHSLLVPYIFPNGKYLGIDISESRNIFDTTSFSSIDSAVVLLYKDGQQFPDTLHCKKVGNKSFYPLGYAPTHGPAEGEEIKIEVTVPGYPKAIAETTIPKRISIRSLQIERIGFEDEDGQIYSKVTLSFQDDPAENNFYEVVLSVNGGEYFPEDYKRLTTFAPYVISENHYPSMLNPDIKKPQYLLFSDKTINGQNVQFEFFYQSKQILDGGIRVLLYDIISVQLRNVSADYYKYRSTWLYSVYSKNGDILYGTGEPLNVYSNVKNGYGIFASFNTDIKTIELDELELR